MMAETARILVARPRSWFGLARRLDVLLDGRVQARLRMREVAEFDVQDGGHTLQLKMDWCTSREVRVCCAAGSVHSFTCKMPRPGLATILSRYETAFDLVPDDVPSTS